MFQVGNAYHRILDLQARYGGQRMVATMTPKRKPYIFLLPTAQGHENGYTEHWDGDVLNMSGSGKVGNQEMKGANRAIHDHEAEGKALHLFWPISGRQGYYNYKGQVRYIGHYFEERTGANGKARKTIMFRLQRVPE